MIRDEAKRAAQRVLGRRSGNHRSRGSQKTKNRQTFHYNGFDGLGLGASSGERIRTSDLRVASPNLVLYTSNRNTLWIEVLCGLWSPRTLRTAVDAGILMESQSQVKATGITHRFLSVGS
jgi:hypothetical protein